MKVEMVSMFVEVSLLETQQVKQAMISLDPDFRSLMLMFLVDKRHQLVVLLQSDTVLVLLLVDKVLPQQGIEYNQILGYLSQLLVHSANCIHLHAEEG